jgi:hypothetical protein
MRICRLAWLCILCGFALAACDLGNDNNTPDPKPSPVPVPTSVDDLVFSNTGVSAEIDAGISEPIPEFTPYVNEMYNWNGTYDPETHLRVFTWQPVGARTTLVHNGMIQYLGYSGTVAVETPRLKHTRYWRKVFSVVLGENTSFSEERAVTYGISETEGHEFSLTVGIEANAWFLTLKTEVSASTSYEITHSTETSTAKTFSAQGADGKETVFTVWQLVNRFYLCDADGVTLHDNKDVLCDRLRLLPGEYYFEEASESEYYLSTVAFDK